MVDSTIATATVMFTDLLGSTELRTRVGEDAAEVLRAAHDVMLYDAIRAHEGRVVKHLGDGVMATFASAASAVAAGVAIQQGNELAARRTGTERLEVRVGISVGDVTLEGDDCFGLPVIEAQRLEASADPGSIRCAELVMRLARGRGGHDFRPLGDLELKGLAEPVAACEVAWEPLEASATPLDVGLPPVLAAGGLPFSGRDDLYESLVGVWEDCAVGGFAAVLLAGEPGVGKTRLAGEFASGVSDGGGLVLAGRCDEDVAVPFQAFGTALEWFVRHTSGGEVATRLGEFPGDLIRLVPHLGDLVIGLPEPLSDEPATERFRLFQAVESWLSVGGHESPRLLVLDDLQWADKPTLLLLRQLIIGRPAGLMVLCTYRDTDVDRAHPLSAMLADFRRMNGVTRIAVTGLGPDGVRELLVRTGGHDLGDDGLQFADMLQRETSGNPFFLSEVLRHLAETGALYERDGRWASDRRPEDFGIPAGIREVVMRRLSRLGDDVQQILRAASVIGYEFDVDLLADVVARDVDGVLAALDTATSAGLVIEVGVDRHRFAHALVRETLHAELSSSRRARQHRKVAEAIEARHVNDSDSVVTELATHWAEATAGGDPTRAIELAIRAGDLALERGAYENGARWFGNVLELIDDTGDLATDVRRRTLVKLADAQTHSGAGGKGRTNALQAAREAIAAGDADTVTTALSISARGAFSEGEDADPEKVTLLREALEMPGLTVLQRAILFGELSVELIMERNIPGRRAALEERDRLIAQLPIVDQARLIASPAQKSYTGMSKDSARKHFGLLVESPTDGLTPTVQRRRNVAIALGAITVGERSVLDEAFARLQQAWTEMPTLLAPIDHIVSNLVFQIDGRLDLAAESAEQLVGAMEALHLPEAPVLRTTTSLAVQRERGGLARMVRLADIAATMGHPAAPTRAVAAFIRLHAGNIEPILAALDEIEEEEFADDAGYAIALGYWSEIVVALGTERQRRRFLELATPLSGLNFMTGGLYLGPTDRLLALLHNALGEHEHADSFFANAVEQQIRMASPPWIARTQLDWAESFLARTGLDRARGCVTAASVAIEDLDLPDARARIASINARLG